MERNLKDKVVLVTGGATGIGYEIADKYLERGAKVVVLLDVNEPEGVNAEKTLTAKYGNNRAAYLKCDVTKDLHDLYEKIVNTYKNIDVLVNNAGILDDTAIKKTIDINVAALIEWSMKFREHMRKEKGGKGGTIINLASIYGFRIDQFLPIYKASKFAVMGFTKSLGHKYNYDRTGVRVVAICPGFTETKLASNPKIWKDEQAQIDFFVFLKGQTWQQVDAVGRAAVEVFEKADSGTAWLIEGAKPISRVA